MSDFIREDRYVVVKRSDIDKSSAPAAKAFSAACRSLHDSMLKNGAPARSFLVIESDWPEYEVAYQMIEARMYGLGSEGRPLESVVDLAVSRGNRIDSLRSQAEKSEQELVDLRHSRDMAEARSEILSDMLIAILDDYEETLKTGRQRILDLGGSCDPLEKMLSFNASYAKARALTIKKQEVESDDN